VGSDVVVIFALASVAVVLLGSVVLTARSLDRRADRRTGIVLDAIGGLRSQLAEATAGRAAGPPHDDGPTLHPFVPAPAHAAVAGASFRGRFIRDRRSSKPPPPASAAERIAARYRELVAAAEAAGESATHCERCGCFQGRPEVDVCTCDCAACVRAGGLMLQAQAEVEGR